MTLKLSRRRFAFLALALCAACAAPKTSTAPKAARPEAAIEPAAPQVAPSEEPGVARPTEPVHFVILHTNDVHGQVLQRKATWLDKQNPPMVGGLERLAAEVSAERRQAEDEGAQVIVVDAGDWYQGTPEGVLDHGRAFLEALALVGYDALCIGNHDLDHGLANLKRILAASRLPAVVANVRAAGGERADWAPPWRIVKRAGLSVALVGLLTPGKIGRASCRERVS
jgi:2',3'-cyclic-nucleotide 2'-phosphodiesterase (5'-nucleotidase family)